MLRLHTQTNPENLPCLYNPVYPQPTYSLHRLEQELSHGYAIVMAALSPCYLSLISLYLRQLFGEDEDASGELDDAEKQGENGQFVHAIPAHQATNAVLQRKKSRR